MEFIKSSIEDAVKAIGNRIIKELKAGKKVVWLVSGGSNIPLEVQTLHRIREDVSKYLEQLTVIPMDERYGAPSHTDSNVEQLREQGFDPSPATFIDVLTHALPFAETVDIYSDAVATAIADADVIIGQFGMGDDGHVAGIKPCSPATAPGAATVIGYNWDDYERMTMSAEALRQITVAYLPAFGPQKKQALLRLQKNTESFESLPAKLLYKIPEVYVYTDNDIA